MKRLSYRMPRMAVQLTGILWLSYGEYGYSCDNGSGWDHGDGSGFCYVGKEDIITTPLS
jgi:hypothetical protein